MSKKGRKSSEEIIQSVKDFRIRCSALGDIMTEPRLKSDKDAGNLSETAKSYLDKWFIETVYGRRRHVTSKEMEKGVECEEEAISLVQSKFPSDGILIKNKTRFTEAYLTGEPDLIHKSGVTDTKVSWDVETYFKSGVSDYSLFTKSGKLTAYGYQGVGYLILTGKRRFNLAYCLVNTPDWQIEGQIRSAWFNKNPAMTEEDFESVAEEIEKGMRFDDIHPSERVTILSVEASDAKIEELYGQIEEKHAKCVEYLIELTEKWAARTGSITVTDWK